MADLGERTAELVTPIPGPASVRLAQRLRRVESRNVTFLGERFPVFWDQALGSNVVDADGNVFVDLTGGFGVALAGHRNPLVTARVDAQLERLAHGMGDVHPPAVKVALLERLASLAPWPDARTVLTPSGSEAVEVALKTALLSTGRAGVLAFEGGYHGLTLGALAVTHRSHFRAPFRERLFEGVAFAPFPTDENGVSGALEAVAAALGRGAPGGFPIGALIVEPIQGRAGVQIPPAGFLSRLAALAQDAGCVVIADEIFTGFGRAGRRFMSVDDEMSPDILCVGKALGGGMPIGGCMAPASVMDAWPASSGEALHTSTFLAHPLSAAGALGFLDEFEDGDLVTRVNETADRLMEELVRVLGDLPWVAEVRGRGLLVGIELAAPDGAALAGAGARVAEAALTRGVIVLPAGDRSQVVELAPAVGLAGPQLAWAVGRLAEAIEEACGLSE